MRPRIDEVKNDTSKELSSEKNLTVYQFKLPLLGIGLALLLASATFFSGLHLGSATDIEASVGSFFLGDTRAQETADLSEFWKVWNELDKKFVGGASTTIPTPEERVAGAIGGLVESYKDPYTVFFPPKEAAAFEESISGNFSGVGMEVGMRDGIITVIAPLPDTPAENAGILSGDQIVRIDESSTEGITVDEAVTLIRGEKGTVVTLTILRKDSPEFLLIDVTRDTILIPTTDTELIGDVFVIKLYSFNALAEAEMQQALRKYIQSGSRKILLDLRGNPGGYLQSAVEISSYFLPTGKVVVRESYGNESEEDLYRSSGKSLGKYAPEKVVVLIDGGSASAAEILAGALKEHGVATLVGTQTFGKGSVQELVNVGDDSSLKVTIARWLTPNGLSISTDGLTPDIIVERSAEQYLNDEDPQQEAALLLLQ